LLDADSSLVDGWMMYDVFTYYLKKRRFDCIHTLSMPLKRKKRPVWGLIYWPIKKLKVTMAMFILCSKDFNMLNIIGMICKL
jgi:hypothetical protein